MKEKNKYLIYGALFGGFFPLLSFIFIRFVSTNITFLFGIICSAPLFLGVFARFAGVRQDNINEINKHLEEKVVERTREIKNLMDVSGQGFLSFGSDYRINTEYSKECEVIFSAPIAGKLIYELLFEDLQKKEDFKGGFDLFFSNKAKPEVIFNLMEKEAVLGGKIIKIAFRILNKDHILCILTDITTERELQKKIKQEDTERNILIRSITHKKYFSSFLKEGMDLFEYLEVFNDKESTSEEYGKLQRMLHTFKGNASFFSFNRTQQSAHDFEFYISDHLVLEEPMDIRSFWINLKKLFYTELRVIQTTLGDEWIKTTNAVIVPQKQYRQIETYINKKYRHDIQLNRTIQHYRKVPFSSLFVRFPDIAGKLAESFGKKLKPVVITGGQFSILPEKYEPLINSLVHIIRNMVDHGIEPPHERDIKNKNPDGEIMINLEKKGNNLFITMSDDGQGISLLRIKKKAIEKNLIPPGNNVTHSELLNLIFSQGFSTSEVVTETSGRGIGMAAVKEKVSLLNGKISVSTRKNRGTTFKVVLPE